MSAASSFPIFEEENLLLELLEETLFWRPQHIVDLGNLVQLIGSREERIQAETCRYIMIHLPQQSYLHAICMTFVYAFGGRQDH